MRAGRRRIAAKLLCRGVLPAAAGILLLLLSASLYAQERVHLGALLTYGYDWHRTAQDVRSPDGDCGRFNHGTGHGPTAGLTGEWEALPWLCPAVRLVYSRLGGTLRATCDNGIIVPTGSGNGFVPLVREYTKYATMDYLLLELGMKIAPLDFPLYAYGGISIGKPWFGASWSQTERIVSPPGALFPDFTAQRSNGSGDFSDTQLRSAVVGGIGYSISLHNRVEFSPEVSYAHPLTDAATGMPWTIAQLRIGASLTWAFDIGAPSPAETPPPPPPPRPPPPPILPTARIAAATDAAIGITETFVTETFPILPYVFFAKNSDSLQGQYLRSDSLSHATFAESSLPRKTLEIYYHLLDIMGKRMRDDPSIAITLIGSTDDKDSEENNRALAAGRARAVKNYLTGSWGIDAQRIRMETERLPPIPTSRLYPEGDEENRRVDIVSESEELFRPVVHERFSEFDITPPVLELSLGAAAAVDLAAWDVTVRLGSDWNTRFNGRGMPPPILRWKLDEAWAARVGEQDTLSALLTVTDAGGNRGSSEIRIPVSKRRSSFEIGRLSLIVFDFDRADIFPFNQRMIRKFVAKAIKPSSSVHITGSTDRLGEEAHNRELSAARAESVKAILLSQNPKYQQLEARGIGEAPALYDNDLPEGRFYCRTVAVEVRTPIE